MTNQGIKKNIAVIIPTLNPGGQITVLLDN